MASQKNQTTAKEKTAGKNTPENTSPENNTQATKVESVADPKVIPVIIPYLKSAASDDELRYAIRSMEANFNFPFTVVVVGDTESWFSDKITHIPHEPHVITEDCNCLTPKQVVDPQADVAHKLLTAITALGIEDKFILMNDDIFVLEPQSLAQLEILKVLPTSLLNTGAEGTAYHKNAQRTAKFLESNGLPIHNYGTHTPMVFDAELFADMLSNIPTTDKGFLLSSLYFNGSNPNARPLIINGSSPNDAVLGSVYRSNPNMDIIEPAFKRRWYFNVNTDGYLAIKPLLTTEFPTKSSFEK